MRTRVYDSVTPANCPADAEMVGGYVDGWYRWPDEAWALFPGAVPIRIAVHPWTDDGAVLDVEPGDASPEEAPGWVLMRQAAGQLGSVYCSLFQWPQVQQAFSSLGMEQPPYWIAAYPGNGAELYPGSVAHQWGGDVDGGYDISVAADFWPGVDGDTPPPPIPPAPPADEEDTMIFGLTITGTGGGLAVLDVAGTLRWCTSFEDYVAIINGARGAGYKVAEIAVTIATVKVWEQSAQVVVGPGSPTDPAALAAAVRSEVGSQVGGLVDSLRITRATP